MVKAILCSGKDTKDSYRKSKIRIEMRIASYVVPFYSQLYQIWIHDSKLLHESFSWLAIAIAMLHKRKDSYVAVRI